MSEHGWEQIDEATREQINRDRQDEAEHLEARELAERERLEERGGQGERVQSTCMVCGERFWNWGAHQERCRGPQR